MSDCYQGPERRDDKGYCDMHLRQLDKMDQVKNKQSKLSGWQKAQAFFITLCFGSVVVFASQTSEKVAEIALSAAKIDKQVAMLISGNNQFQKAQTIINHQVDGRFCAIDEILDDLRLANQEIHTRLNYGGGK